MPDVPSYAAYQEALEGHAGPPAANKGECIIRSLLLGPQFVRGHGPCGHHGSLRVPVCRQPLCHLTALSSPCD